MRMLISFPTRRSSDLQNVHWLTSNPAQPFIEFNIHRDVQPVLIELVNVEHQHVPEGRARADFAFIKNETGPEYFINRCPCAAVPADREANWTRACANANTSADPGLTLRKSVKHLSPILTHFVDHPLPHARIQIMIQRGSLR